MKQIVNRIIKSDAKQCRNCGLPVRSLHAALSGNDELHLGCIPLLGTEES